MSTTPNIARPCWFVGAVIDGSDQTERFLAEGVWESGDPASHGPLLRAMRPGDRIAVKAAYTRKKGLKFDAGDRSVSIMSIKAVGEVAAASKDGVGVRVNWRRLEPAREWLFYTNRKSIWRVTPGDWPADSLIAFAFEGAEQDVHRFLEAPYWRERYGGASASGADAEPRFAWTSFYEAFADALRPHRVDRSKLVTGLCELADGSEKYKTLKGERFADGDVGCIRDICPFTLMALFNRGHSDVNRIAIAGELASLLGLDLAPPRRFDGIPVFDNRNSWMYPYEKDRQAGQIDALWDVFDLALRFADAPDDRIAADFSAAYDRVSNLPNIGYKLSCGLYWIRPWRFPTLDAKSREHLKRLGVPLGLSGPQGRPSGRDYVALADALEQRYGEAEFPVHSHPELSLAAWLYKAPTAEGAPPPVSAPESSIPLDVEEIGEDLGAAFIPYGIEDVIAEGAFVDEAALVDMLDALREKKNIILQGPPGVGKTWLARRLAYLLMGQKADRRIRAVQFHPNLTYEDFVRGLRPTADGRLAPCEGVFMQTVAAASVEPESIFVVLIEEINRGAPAQIFGELLTLVEAGKRSPSEALELHHPGPDGSRTPVYVPANVFIIGTMNIADRSLALVDFAFRRRFGFIELEPRLDKPWFDFVVKRRNLDSRLAIQIKDRLQTLNEDIASDPRLGPQFRIGHSFVTPTKNLPEGASLRWWERVVRTELIPLFDEYWFDDSNKAAEMARRLLHG